MQKINGKEMFQFFLEKAEKGDALAQNRVAHMYEIGYGVRKDRQKAFEWYQKAAEQKNLDALFQLGEMYLNSDLHDKVVEKNEQKAFEYYLQAAERGHCNAQYSVGMLYLEQGNPDKWIEWFIKVMEQKNIYSKTTLMKIRFFFQGICWRNIDDDTFDKCLEYADKGNIAACYLVGKFLYEGIYTRKRGEVKDNKKALDYFVTVLVTGLTDHFGGEHYRKDLYSGESVPSTYIGGGRRMTYYLPGLIEILEMWDKNEIAEQDKQKVLRIIEITADCEVMEAQDFIVEKQYLFDGGKKV